jgi:hypothetical protein
MTRLEVDHIKRILERIKDPDGHVKQAIASCDRKLAEYDARRGQIKEHYDVDFKW